MGIKHLPSPRWALPMGGLLKISVIIFKWDQSLLALKIHHSFFSHHEHEQTDIGKLTKQGTQLSPTNCMKHLQIQWRG